MQASYISKCIYRSPSIINTLANLSTASHSLIFLETPVASSHTAYLQPIILSKATRTTAASRVSRIYNTRELLALISI